MYLWICAPNKDSDQLAHLIRIFIGHIFDRRQSFFIWKKTLISAVLLHCMDMFEGKFSLVASHIIYMYISTCLFLFYSDCLFHSFWQLSCLFIPCHTIVAGYYGFTLDIHVSVVHPSIYMFMHPSVFHFEMITWVNLSGFSPNFVCALIL